MVSILLEENISKIVVATGILHEVTTTRYYTDNVTSNVVLYSNYLIERIHMKVILPKRDICRVDVS